jgi:mRNA interferase HigB
MRIIAISQLRAFWNKHPQAEMPLRAWYADASRADWKSPADIKAAYRNASFLPTTAWYSTSRAMTTG